MTKPVKTPRELTLQFMEDWLTLINQCKQANNNENRELLTLILVNNFLAQLEKCYKPLEPIDERLLKELLDTLVDVINQACQVKFEDKKSYVDDMCLSAYEDAFDLLERLGLLKKDKGRMAIIDFDTSKALAKFGIKEEK